MIKSINKNNVKDVSKLQKIHFYDINKTIIFNKLSES